MWYWSKKQNRKPRNKSTFTREVSTWERHFSPDRQKDKLFNKLYWGIWLRLNTLVSFWLVSFPPYHPFHLLWVLPALPSKHTWIWSLLTTSTATSSLISYLDFYSFLVDLLVSLLPSNNLLHIVVRIVFQKCKSNDVTPFLKTLNIFPSYLRKVSTSFKW